MLKFKPGKSINNIELDFCHDQVIEKMGWPQEIFKTPPEVIEEPEDNTYYWCYLNPDMEVEFFKGRVVCIHIKVNLPKTYKTFCGNIGKQMGRGDYSIKNKRRYWEYYSNGIQFTFNSKNRIIDISVDNKKKMENF